MAFKKVGNGSFKYVKYKECEAGQVLAVGTYLGTREGTYGIQHQVRDDEGNVTVLDKSGHLNFLLANHVSKGDYIQVVYTGTELMTKGKFKGKEMHQFDVLVDEDRGNDSSASAVGGSNSTADTEDDGEDVDDTPAPRKVTAATTDDEDEDDLGDEEEEAPAPAPAAAAPATKKKMSSEELLAKYRPTKKGA